MIEGGDLSGYLGPIIVGSIAVAGSLATFAYMRGSLETSQRFLVKKIEELEHRLDQYERHDVSEARHEAHKAIHEMHWKEIEKVRDTAHKALNMIPPIN